MNRRRALTLLAGSGMLAGCATHASPLLHLPANGDPGRTASRFPRVRPDGSLPPRSAASYHPVHEIVGAPVRRGTDLVDHICFGDSCPGDGGGGVDGGGSQPDTLVHVGRVFGYYFGAQNYVETWSDDGTTLLVQWYWGGDGLRYWVNIGTPDSDTSNTGGPTRPCDNCSTTTQSVAVSVQTATRTFSAAHVNGSTITGVADASGNVALTASVGGDVATVTIGYQAPRQSCSLIGFQASAAIAPIVLNGLGSLTSCNLVPGACSAGGVLVGAMTAGTIAAVKQWEAAAAASC